MENEKKNEVTGDVSISVGHNSSVKVTIKGEPDLVVSAIKGLIKDAKPADENQTSSTISKTITNKPLKTININKNDNQNKNIAKDKQSEKGEVTEKNKRKMSSYEHWTKKDVYLVVKVAAKYNKRRLNKNFYDEVMETLQRYGDSPNRSRKSVEVTAHAIHSFIHTGKVLTAISKPILNALNDFKENQMISPKPQNRRWESLTEFSQRFKENGTHY